MADKKLIIEMTPFVYEDGNIYYFKIESRSSLLYHNLYVYKKVEKKYIKFFRKFHKEEYVCLNPNDGKLVDVNLKLDDVKRNIKEVLVSYNTTKIIGWDGLVGDVPEEIRKSFIRDSKLNDILEK